MNPGRNEELSPLERFRSYLQLLAEAQLDHRLRSNQQNGYQIPGKATGRNEITRSVSEVMRRAACSSLTLRVTVGKPISSGRHTLF